jgi:hypothetical protein
MDVNPDRKRDWGRRLDVFWEGDGVYYRGTVTGYSTSSGKHTIMYDDGDVERVKLTEVCGSVWQEEVGLHFLSITFAGLDCLWWSVSVFACT